MRRLSQPQARCRLIPVAACLAPPAAYRAGLEPGERHVPFAPGVDRHPFFGRILHRVNAPRHALFREGKHLRIHRKHAGLGGQRLDVARGRTRKYRQVGLPLPGIKRSGVASRRAETYGTYGGLLYLGVLLGIVFLFAAVLIMYYKQIVEGYEDQARFSILQKVGMTRREIRKSINSQVLTVFFLPLAAAGIHLAFAFPLVYRMLALFSLTNRRLLALVTLCCFLVYALFYVLVYRATSRAYYAIVSGGREEAP